MLDHSLVSLAHSGHLKNTCGKEKKKRKPLREAVWHTVLLLEIFFIDMIGHICKLADLTRFAKSSVG